jgi:hypothetical protein
VVTVRAWGDLCGGDVAEITGAVLSLVGSVFSIFRVRTKSKLQR